MDFHLIARRWGWEQCCDLLTEYTQSRQPLLFLSPSARVRYYVCICVFILFVFLMHSPKGHWTCVKVASIVSVSMIYSVWLFITQFLWFCSGFCNCVCLCVCICVRVLVFSFVYFVYATQWLVRPQPVQSRQPPLFPYLSIFPTFYPRSLFYLFTGNPFYFNGQVFIPPVQVMRGNMQLSIPRSGKKETLIMLVLREMNIWI